MLLNNKTQDMLQVKVKTSLITKRVTVLIDIKKSYKVATKPIKISKVASRTIIIVSFSAFSNGIHSNRSPYRGILLTVSEIHLNGNENLNRANIVVGN